MTIVQIRGTSGSGKSTLVRAVSDSYTQKASTFIAGRKQPLFETFRREGSPPLSIVGHYNTACGGADTISSGFEYIFNLVRELHFSYQHNVLFEGLLMTGDTRHIIALHADIPGAVHAISLATPLEQCLNNIQQRRLARGDTRPIKPANTTSKFKGDPKCRAAMAEAGMAVEHLPYPEALHRTKELLQCL